MKFWFSALIWRNLRLRLIECSQVFTVRLLLVKNRVVSGFIASRAVILMSRTGIAVEKRKFSKFPNWRYYLLKTRAIVRRIVRIIGNYSISHFETAQSNGNDSEVRKLDSVRVEDERFWTAILWLWTAAPKTESEWVSKSHCERRRKMGPLR